MYLKKNVNVYPRSFHKNLNQGNLTVCLLIQSLVLFSLFFNQYAVFQVVRILLRGTHSGNFESPKHKYIPRKDTGTGPPTSGYRKVVGKEFMTERFIGVQGNLSFQAVLNTLFSRFPSMFHTGHIAADFFAHPASGIVIDPVIPEQVGREGLFACVK